MRLSRGLARLGVLVPFTNVNLEPDLTLMAPPGLSLHMARMGGYDEDEIPDETQMAGLGASDLREELTLLAGAKPDVVLYGCTSATLSHGPAFDEGLAAQIKALSGAETVTAAGAVVEGLQTLGADQIGFASPYVPALNDRAIDFLAQCGITTVQRADIGSDLSNEAQGALSPEEVYALGLRADGPNVRAVLLSCTDMRSVEIAQNLEAQLGKPVVTSNQALLCAALRRIGYTDPVPGFGTLLSREREALAS